MKSVFTSNQFIILLFACFLAAAITSCRPHVMCGDMSSKAPKSTSKRYKMALAERDSLCNFAKQEQAQLDALNKDYANLKSSAGTTVATLSDDLRSKQSELDKKEKDLRDKEARLREMQRIVNRQDSIMSALTNTVKNALLGFKADELTIYMKDGKVYVSMSDKLLFKSGSADVEAKGKEALKKLGDVLNKNGDVSIAIEGHTDNVPIKTATYKDNWDLSAARATNVVRLLTDENGMDPRRLTAAGRGEFSPVADNATTEGKAKNRRTEIVLSPKLDELMKVLSYK